MLQRIAVVSEEHIKEDNGIAEDDCGVILFKDVQLIVASATKLNLRCLSFISQNQDSIFNEYQVEEIKKEIALLRSYSEINPIPLDIIQHGTEVVSQKMCLFLKFHKAT